MASNTFRGALGESLRRIACKPGCTGPETCASPGQCGYSRLFEPVRGGGGRGEGRAPGPSGLAQPPRPFVLRTAHLEGGSVDAGERFYAGLNLFLTDPAAVQLISDAFEDLGRQGIGAGRSRAELLGIEGRGEPVLYHLQPPFSDLSGAATVIFLTPTELKVKGGLAPRPEFGILARRIRDRVSTLSEMYGEGPLELDFDAFGQRAEQARMTRCDIRPVAVDRRSSRTGQRHPLGGFVGEAAYDGVHLSLVPFLKLAEWTGVGRQTSWGKGAIRVAVEPDGETVANKAATIEQA